MDETEASEALRDALTELLTKRKNPTDGVIIINAVVAAEVMIDGEHSLWTSATTMPLWQALGLTQALGQNLSMELADSLREGRYDEYDD